MRYSFCNVILVSILFTVCIGCKDKSRPTYLITDQKLVRGVAIKYGSYFIYEDSATHSEDSLAPVMANHQNVYNENSNAYYETANYQLHVDHPVGATIAVVTTAGWQGKVTGYFSSSYGTFNTPMLVSLPFVEGSTEGYSVAVYKYIKHYDSFAVLGKFYQDVYEVVSHLLPADTFHSYFSIESGLVRFMTYKDGVRSVWNLKRSFVLR